MVFNTLLIAKCLKSSVSGAKVLLKHQCSFTRRHLKGSRCCSKTFGSLFVCSITSRPEEYNQPSRSSSCSHRDFSSHSELLKDGWTGRVQPSPWWKASQLHKMSRIPVLFVGSVTDGCSQWRCENDVRIRMDLYKLMIWLMASQTDLLPPPLPMISWNSCFVLPSNSRSTKPCWHWNQITFRIILWNVIQ